MPLRPRRTAPPSVGPSASHLALVPTLPDALLHSTPDACVASAGGARTGRGPARSGWTTRRNGAMTRAIGERGLTVRVYQRVAGGPFQRELRMPGRGKSRRSLETCDPGEAWALTKRFYGALLADHAPVTAGHVTLRRLWEEYRVSPEFRAKASKTQRDDATHAMILMGYYGEGRDVSTLTASQQTAFEQQRRIGGIAYSRDGEYQRDTDGRVTDRLVVHTTGPTRARAAQADLVLLHTMLTWATRHRTANGAFWLTQHPLNGAVRAAEKNPRRPITTIERFLATRDAMQRLRAACHPASLKWSRWVKLELALVLAEATGRRLGAIRQLEWTDVDEEESEIMWRADSDKKGIEWHIPMSEELRDELRAFHALLRGDDAAAPSRVFAAELNDNVCMDRHLFDKWLGVAERTAGLPKLEGGAWHPYRRKWAMERKAFPLTDVAAAGGWKDVESLLNCYAQPDRSTMLAVMSTPIKLRTVDLARARTAAARGAQNTLRTRLPDHEVMLAAVVRRPARAAAAAQE